MHVPVIMVDDNKDNFRALKAILDPKKREWDSLKWGDESITFALHPLVAKSRDGELDMDETLGRIERNIPGVAIIDMRLLGDDPNDFTGIDLLLQIKSKYPDCCMILISSYFRSEGPFARFRHLDVLRYLVDRSQPSEKLAADLTKEFEMALSAHAGSVDYRRTRFAATVNNRERHMWALTLQPGTPGIMIDRSVPLPYLRSNSVMVETIELGVCGTDRHALGGTLARSACKIIDFHEAFGRVVWTGEDVRGLREGDLVVPMVRRCQTWEQPADKGEIGPSGFEFPPCHKLPRCASAHQPDRCAQGRHQHSGSGVRRVGYTSRGTGKCHGFGSQYFLDVEDWLVRIDPPNTTEEDLRERMMRRYVLAEPMSIVWKMRREILRVYRVREYRDEVLIIGLGPIGLLAAMVLRELNQGLRFTALDLADFGNRRVQILRDRYPEFEFVQAEAEDRAPDELSGRRFQIIIEATDQPENVLRYAPSLLSPGGILVLLGISGDENRTVQIDATIVSELVRSGNTVVGSVNSSRIDYEDSIAFMERVIGSRPSLLDDMVDRWSIDDALPRRLLDLGNTLPRDRPEIKVVLKAKEFSDRISP